MLNTKDTLREKQKAIYNNRHRASELDPQNKGQHVFIPDLETEGTVVGKGDKPRAYNIETPKGLRTWNRTALCPIPEVPRTPEEQTPRSPDFSTESLVQWKSNKPTSRSSSHKGCLGDRKPVIMLNI